MLLSSWILLVTSTFLDFTSAEQPTPSFSHFALYKNTHFGPCPTTAPENATLPTPDTSSGNDMPNNASLSHDAFCNRFWNYTVLPSAPTPGAFSLSWANTLINMVVYPLYIFSAHAANDKAYAWDSIDNVDGGGAARPHRKLFRVQHERSGFVAHAKHLLWWPLFVYAAVEMVLWWVSFGIILAHPRDSHPMLSPLASIATFALTLSWYVELQAAWYRVLRWPAITLGVLQLVASGVALVLFYRFHRTAEQYRVDAGFDLTPFANCDVGSLLRDPTDTTYLVSLGSSPVLLAYGVWVLAVAGMLFWRFSVKAATLCVSVVCLLVGVFSLISLAITLQRKVNPIAWDPTPGCALVHVMMGSGYGYYDVRVESARDVLQKLQSFFAVVY